MSAGGKPLIRVQRPTLSRLGAGLILSAVQCLGETHELICRPTRTNRILLCYAATSWRLVSERPLAASNMCTRSMGTRRSSTSPGRTFAVELMRATISSVPARRWICSLSPSGGPAQDRHRYPARPARRSPPSSSDPCWRQRGRAGQLHPDVRDVGEPACSHAVGDDVERVARHCPVQRAGSSPSSRPGRPIVGRAHPTWSCRLILRPSPRAHATPRPPPPAVEPQRPRRLGLVASRPASRSQP